jgi:hypothetical protein
MNNGESFFPIVKKIYGNTIADELISWNPNDTWEEAVRKHHMKKRIEKINKIKSKINARLLSK